MNMTVAPPDCVAMYLKYALPYEYISSAPDKKG